MQVHSNQVRLETIYSIGYSETATEIRPLLLLFGSMAAPEHLACSGFSQKTVHFVSQETVLVIMTLF